MRTEGLVAAGDTCRALGHHPVFGAMVVHLQRQGGAWFDRQALHLETGPVVDAPVRYPRPVDTTVYLVFIEVASLQLVDDYPDFLRLVLARHQQTVLGVLGNYVAPYYITFGVARAYLPQRRPGADVRQARGKRHDHGTIGVFHDRIIDTVSRAGEEGLALYVEVVAVLLAL